MNDIDLTKIKNIIFDLGVVLLDVDDNKAFNAFVDLGIQDIMSFRSFFRKHEIFTKHEEGSISDQDFINEIKKYTGLTCSGNKIVDAWNKIIVGFPEKKTDFLIKAKKHFKIFLLSNTDGIHAKEYERLFREQTGIAFENVFDAIYYSHVIHTRKPDAAAYKRLLTEQMIRPEETLFFDDLEDNVKAAGLLGIKSVLYKKETDFFYIFDI